MSSTIIGQKEILEFQIAQLKTVAKLDMAKIIGHDDEMSVGKGRYGAFLYLDPDTDQYSFEQLHIGSTLTETWTMNLDIIVKEAHKNPEKKYTSTYGSDYWIRTMRALFLHKQNDGEFEDMTYEHLQVLDVDNTIRITGLITTVVENTYPAC